MIKSQPVICVIFLSLFLCLGCKDKHPLFLSLPSDETGIKFKNTLHENDSINILDFEYMYNGGGVGVLDVNQDGLQDLFFTGNQVSSRLYLNQGNLKFKDITMTAGVQTSGWCNGVSIVDINNDSFPDIYVSRGGPRGTTQDKMANLLFVNDGEGKFQERAKEYGIADIGYSIQGLFFDYDKDGYKDLYLLTNALVDFNRNIPKPVQLRQASLSADRLYKNNGDGTFKNVSKEAGVIKEGFGLGVSICDFNHDGWIDVYVSNDFLTNDILYMNNKDGTFTNQINKYVKHQSFNGMGVDIADLNNDKLTDILVMDMMPRDNTRIKQTLGYFSNDKFNISKRFGYQPEFVRNTFQLNNGDESFSEIGQLSSVFNTDWSWAPLIADFNNDGWKDIYITNGYRRDVTNLDFINYGRQNGAMGTPEAIKKNALKRLKNLPEIKLSNYMFENNKDLTFKSMEEAWGLGSPSYSNGAAYADLDNDGDLDLVVNNIDQEAFLFENKLLDQNQEKKSDTHYIKISLKGNPNPEGTEVFIYNNSLVQTQFYSTVRGYLSSVEDHLHFGISGSKIDSIKVVWPDQRTQTLKSVSSDQRLTVSYKNAQFVNKEKNILTGRLFEEVSGKYNLNFLHTENDFSDFKLQPSLIHMNSRLGPGISVGDLDNNGLDDIYIGGATGTSGKLFYQTETGNFLEGQLSLDSEMEEMGSLIFDCDNDGDLDIVVAGGGGDPSDTENYKTVLYINKGNGNFIQGESFNEGNSAGIITASDYDRDGDLDLFIGNRIKPGNYPLSSPSIILQNNNGSFKDVTKEVFGSSLKKGMVTSALWTDFDNDGWPDLIVTGEFMKIRFYRNTKGQFEDITDQSGITNSSGWWNSISGGDFDNDGDTDYICGNFGLNSTFKASPEEPIKLYANDFDKNGVIDPILTCYRDGEEQIVHTRDILIQQINAMRVRFTTYESYAKANLSTSFTQEELKSSYTLKVNNLKSSYIENLGNGHFKIEDLPINAQFAPVFGIRTLDFNADGNLDVMLVGNMFEMEPLTGQNDAFNGLLLEGDGKGHFQVIPSMESGLRVAGNARAASNVQMGDHKNLFLFSQNNEPLKVYEATNQDKNIKFLRIKKDDLYAMVYEKGGKKHKEEFYYGGGYLSQSSRGLRLNTSRIDSVTVMSYRGNQRNLHFNMDDNEE